MITKAAPIWLGETEKNQYIEIIQHFTVNRLTESAVLCICADTQYVVYINGRFVGTGQYLTFPGKKVYDEYEVAQLLNIGDNVIYVEAYCQGENSQIYHENIPAVVYSIDGGCAVLLSGEDAFVRKHPHYRSGVVEKISPQIGYTFYYDASAKETKWQKAAAVEGFDVIFQKRPVEKLLFKKPVQGKIRAQGYLKRNEAKTVAQTMQQDWLSAGRAGDIISPSGVVKKCEGAYFLIDLGDEYAGIFEMSIYAAAGTVIDVSYGEHTDDLRVRASVGGRNFAFRYICRDGSQYFRGYFRRIAGRYIEIHITNMTGDVIFERVGIIPTEYPIKRTAIFHCSDYFINKLYEISVKTMKLCMHEHYEDCPWREQALYAFDSYVQMLCGYYAFGEYEFARASLKLLADGIRDDGLLSICAPSGVKITIPSFSLAWILSLEKYVLYSGDTEFGKEMLHTAKRILDSFTIENGLVFLNKKEDLWHFYEWNTGLNGNDFKECGCDSPNNFYYITACEAYNKICAYVGEIPYECDLNFMKERIRETFFDEETGLFRTHVNKKIFHEFTQALSLYSKTADNAEYIADILADTNSALIKITPGCSLFKYEALLSLSEKYSRAVIDEIAAVWGKMLFSGANALWEVSDGADGFQYAASLCHAWSAIPVYIIFKYYLGFEPTAPGFSQYRVQVNNALFLQEAEVSLFTPTENKIIKIKDAKAVEKQPSDI